MSLYLIIAFGSGVLTSVLILFCINLNSRLKRVEQHLEGTMYPPTPVSYSKDIVFSETEKNPNN